MYEIADPFADVDIRRQRTPEDKRNAVLKVLLRDDVTMSHVLLTDRPVRQIALELLHGVQISASGVAEARRSEVSGRLFKIRTVDGRPLTGPDGHLKAGIIVGCRELTSGELRGLHRRGGSEHIFAQYPEAEIAFDARMASEMLGAWGWGIREPRYWPRRLRPGEVDATGQPATQRDRWIIYEVGGPLEQHALAEQAKGKRGR